ncbi:LADA_0E09406g1_1 [Lachancea dasiensis]|uniref:LADA_0E09406g1_1 n=1 Tax=Lachancea dasiensis TaxID=1072105 RepID=A0A1G4JED7_9SACH|nr:LADA_0E09406g1_1 [Lachancea dasiensis]
MHTGSPLMAQDYMVFDLSDHSSRPRHTLQSFPTAAAHSASERPSAYYQNSSGRLHFNRDEGGDTTDEEEEQSLIKPLMDAHNNASSESPLGGVPRTLPYRRTHKPQHSQTVTILDEPKASPPPFFEQPLTMSQFDLQQTQNYQQRAALRLQAEQQERKKPTSSEKILGKFCKWSRYSLTQSKETGPAVKRKKSMKRANSLSRRKDFSNGGEITQLAESGNFVFHRGFSLRRSRHPSLRYKFRSRAELTSVMNYINPESLPCSNFTSGQRMLVMQLKSPTFWQVMRLHPRFVFKTLPSKPIRKPSRNISQWYSPVEHRNSIKRKFPAVRRVASVRRTKSHPGPHRLSLSQLENKQLYNVWRHYLMSVVLQRIQFRQHLSTLYASSLSSTSQGNGYSAEFSFSTPSEGTHLHNTPSGSDSDSYGLTNSLTTSRSFKSFGQHGDVASLSSVGRADRGSRLPQKAH